MDKNVILYKIRMKGMILIADSGSTKTAWCLVENQKTMLYTQGINPYQQNEEEICSILRNELLPTLVAHLSSITSIHFYGAGCTPEKAPVVAEALRKVISTTADISVESDMLGAARGACGQQPGIVCILGTGSNSCYYDGRDLHPGIPALGYILGDEGSGAYLGKRLVGDILKRQLPEDVVQAFFEETQETQASIIQKVYRAPLPNRFLASLSPFCARHKDHPAIHRFIIDCFEQFFTRNILSAAWAEENRLVPIHFVGSVAYYYQKELKEVIVHHGYQIGTVVQSPLEGIVQYHQESTTPKTTYAE